MIIKEKTMSNIPRPEQDEYPNDGDCVGNACGVSPEQWKAANTINGIPPEDWDRVYNSTQIVTDSTHNGNLLNQGGEHYKKGSIQPIEYIMANKLSFAEGNIVKYITRWRNKGGIKDLEKARHYIDFLIEAEQEIIDEERRYEERNGIY